MSTPTMNEVSRTTSRQIKPLSVQNLKAIKLPDGWHNVSDCEIVEFAVSNSPSDKYYSTLKYVSQSGQTAYAPFRNILAFSEESAK